MLIRKRRFMLTWLAAAVGLLLLVPGNIQAIPLYSCAPGAECNGNEYGVSVLSHVGITYQLQYDIHVLNTYTGNKWTDVVAAVSLKNFVGTYSNFSLISAPGGLNNWNLSQLELNAGGCGGGPSGGLCAEAIMPYTGAAFLAGDILSWVFQFDTLDALSGTASIKYLYEDVNGKKVGSLGSWTINVPEPSTLILLGSGLIGLGILGRKRFNRI